MLMGIPLSVILATLIGTPHTLFDAILYVKIGLNLFTGGVIWGFYYVVILWFDRTMPWESTYYLKRWTFQMGISMPVAILFMWGMVNLRNELIEWPFSTHLFLYTDIPILFLISIAIHFFYQQGYLAHWRKQAVNKAIAIPDVPEPAPMPAVITVKKIKKTYVVPIKEVAYFYRKAEFNFLRKWDGQELMIDQSLAASEASIDADIFFSINRQLLVNRQAICSYKVLDTRQTELQLTPPLDEGTLLNKNRFAQFKQWLQAE